MEGLIIMIILGIVSSLFKKSKAEEKNKPTTSMPPFSSQPAPRQRAEAKPEPQRQQSSRTNQSRSLEDFANEVFGKLNDRQKPEVRSTQREALGSRMEPVREVVEKEVAKVEAVHNPRSLRERPIVQMIKQQEAKSLNVVPKTQHELMQAIVMSEILGSPKSKQQ